MVDKRYMRKIFLDDGIGTVYVHVNNNVKPKKDIRIWKASLIPRRNGLTARTRNSAVLVTRAREERKRVTKRERFVNGTLI